jgi:ABC-type nitrate/sulfonate/bicarbonate transport system substrate-binding protein
VVSRDWAGRHQVTPKSSLAERARALKGATIANDAPRTIGDGTLRYILSKGGVDSEKELTVANMAVSAMPAALEAKRIDGFVMSSPWTTLSEQHGGMILVSGIRGDLPDITPFTMSIVMARAGYCEANADICRKFGRGLLRGIAFVLDQPDKALEILRTTRFKEMDPALVRTAFEDQRKLLQRHPITEEKALQNAQTFAIKAGLLKAGEERASFAGVFNNAFVQ